MEQQSYNSAIRIFATFGEKTASPAAAADDRKSDEQEQPKQNTDDDHGYHPSSEALKKILLKCSANS